MSLAISSTDPPSTTPSSTIRVRSVPRRGRRGIGDQPGDDEQQGDDQEDVARPAPRVAASNRPAAATQRLASGAGQGGQAEQQPGAPATARARPVPATAARRQGQHGGDQGQPARDLSNAPCGRSLVEHQTEHEQRRPRRPPQGIQECRCAAAGGVGLGTGMSLHGATLPSPTATIRLHDSRGSGLGDSGAGVDVRWLRCVLARSSSSTTTTSSERSPRSLSRWSVAGR